MGVTVVSILMLLEGSELMWGLRCVRPAETIPGWLLVVSAIIAAASTSASSSVVVGHVLVLREGIDVAWGLLADGHAELLDVHQVDLHHGQAGCLAFDGFLSGCVRGAKEPEGLDVRHD